MTRASPEGDEVAGRVLEQISDDATIAEFSLMPGEELSSSSMLPGLGTMLRGSQWRRPAVFTYGIGQKDMQVSSASRFGY